jgi:6-phospho-beta-glucosidase
MKIAIIGAGGVRTPLIIQAILKRQDILGITELALMDIDGERLELIGALTAQIEHSPSTRFRIIRTTDPNATLAGADFVITTFRVGGIESRVIDERVPLNYGVLGQETTGPGGFAMGVRSIPVLLGYVELMQEVCPDAWLINFANPAGMLTEAVIRNSRWKRIVGICDGPASMHELISAVLGARIEDVGLDYFGLNHLGWIRHIIYMDQDKLPEIIQLINTIGGAPGLPFDPGFIKSLGMIPNEYLYYYYYNFQAVKNILQAEECRGEQVARENLALFSELKEKIAINDLDRMQAAFQIYLDKRGSTYMVRETGKDHDFSSLAPNISASIGEEGYAGVALNLIEGLLGRKPSIQILNVANNGAIPNLEGQDVVEIPVQVSCDNLQPMPIKDLPMHCLGLILQVKHYEHLSIQASMENSYQKALLALTVHPLVRDYPLAKCILNEYIKQHGSYFPDLK